MTGAPIFQQLQEIRAYTTGVLRARQEYYLRPFADGHRHPGPNDENWSPGQFTPSCDWCGDCDWCDNLHRPTLSAATDTITPTQPNPEPETQP